MEVEVVIRDYRFWILLISVIIVAIIVGVMMTHLQQPPLPGQPPAQAFIVIWILLYFIMAYISFRAMTLASYPQQIGIYTLFFINLILQVIWAWFFSQGNYQSALVTLALLIIAAIFLFVLIWWINPFYGFIFLVYVIWLFVTLWFNMQYVKSQEGTDTESTDNLYEISIENDESPNLPSGESSVIIS